MKNRSFILLFVFLSIACFSQDSTQLNYKWDTTFHFKSAVFSRTYRIHDYSIAPYPTKQDTINCKKYAKLIKAEPTAKNHSKYFSLASSLWELGRIDEAEPLFLKVVASKEPYYVGTYYNSSDIPGDTTTNTYGYGSYTSNYKNYACRYLSKIYIEQKQFEKALTYIEYADKKYTIVHNCGTGHMRYRNEIEGLYSLAYEGAGKYDSIITMFLPYYDDHSNGPLTRALKKVYSPSQINQYLQQAENSIHCVVDSTTSSTYVTRNYGTKEEQTTEIKYTSGTATMNLFGIQVTMPRPTLNEGERVSRELYLKEFKASDFYIALSENE